MRQGSVNPLFAIILLSIAVAGASRAAAVKDPIRINRSASYLDDAVGTPEIRSSCSWNTRLVRQLASRSKKLVVISDADLTQVSGLAMSIVITNVHAMGGGKFTGPKWAYVRVTLRRDGQAIAEYETGSRATLRHLTFTSCKVLDKIADSTAAKIDTWLRNPKKNAHMLDPELPRDR